MKKLFIVFAAIMLAVIVVYASAEPVFAFEYFSYDVGVKKSFELKPVLQGAELNGKATYTWESDNPEIATVSNKGKVTGVGPGTTTIRVRLEDAAGNAYSTSCEVNVIQLVEKIVFEEKEIKVGVFHSVTLEPKVYPENATNPKLAFSTDNKTACYVYKDTGKVEGKNGNQSCYVTAEATDGSGVKAKIKVNVQTFVLPVHEIEITERKTYYLYFDGLTDGHTTLADGYYFKYPRQDIAYLGNHTGGADNNGWFGVAKETVTNEETKKKETKHMLRIEPYKKAGKITVTFYDHQTTWGRGFTKETLVIVVKPSAVYGKEAFPPLKYEEVAANPDAFTGQDAQLSGVITHIEYTDSGSKSALKLVVATKGKDGNSVTCMIRGRYANVLQSTYREGEKVTIFGAWEEPQEIRTETGLNISNLVLTVEKINDYILNEEMVMQKYKP